MKTVSAKKIVVTPCDTHTYVITIVVFYSAMSIKKRVVIINDIITLPIRTFRDSLFVSVRKYLIKSFCMLLSLIRSVNLETYRLFVVDLLLEEPV